MLFFFPLAAGGILVPDQGLNPQSLHWKHGVLTTGLPGNPTQVLLIILPISGECLQFRKKLIISASFAGLGQACTIYRSIKPWERDAEFKVHSCEKGQQEKEVFWRLWWQWHRLFEAALFLSYRCIRGMWIVVHYVLVRSGSWWRTGKPGVLQAMGSQRAGHNWATELNWYVCPGSLCGIAAGEFLKYGLGVVLAAKLQLNFWHAWWFSELPNIIN